VGQRIFVAAGAPADLAQIVVDHLVSAHLAGHDSHGFIQIPGYLRQIRAGTLQPARRPEVVRETPTIALVDGKWGFGQVSARYATEVAIRKAKELQLALVGLVRCTHIGRLGEYTTLAAAQDVITMVSVAGPTGDIVAPYGGRKGAFSTNPWSIGFPAERHPDVMLDFATSVIAGGKVMVARAKGEAVPSGCLLDRDGNPTTDPNVWFDGGVLLPFGGHKGSALALMSALFSSVLTGAEDYAGGADQSGTFILAIDAGAFRPAAEVKASTDRVADRIKAIPPADGFSEVMLPGEPEVRTRERRLREGIPLPEATWQELQDAAASLGVSLS
jgi:LDH2 family malate/lactate/ureidoglycolate dehydrogenase